MLNFFNKYIYGSYDRAHEDTQAPPDQASRVPPGTAERPPDTVESFAAEIRKDWQKTPATILAVARKCAARAPDLDSEQRNKLFKNKLMPFGRSTFAKLVGLAGNAALYESDRCQHLPANWTILYELRDCAPEELDRAVKEGALNPNCRRKDVIAWLNQNCACRERREAERKKKARKPTDEARDHEQLEKLRSAFRESGIAAIFDTYPLAVRQKFARAWSMANSDGPAPQCPSARHWRRRAQAPELVAAGR